jgi:hypothetical protein
MTEMKTVGSKAEVYHETARHTSGYLYKKDLMKHKGRIISRKKHAAGKKAIKHLFAKGYKPKKGTFKLFHKGDAKKSEKKSKKRSTRRRSTRKRRGGSNPNAAAGAAKALMEAL